MKTLALFSQSLFNSYSQQVWQGFRLQARSLGYRAILLCGDLATYFRSGSSLGAGGSHDAYSNLLVEIFDLGRFEGLVVWSAMLNHSADKSVIEQFLQGLVPLPLISLGLPVPGIYSVVVDNRKGVSSLVDHMIEIHGYHRLVYVAGNDTTDHYEISERLLGFKEGLARHGIGVDPRLIVLPTDVQKAAEGEEQKPAFRFQFESLGDQVAKVLFETRGLRLGRDFDAIVCRDDWTAIEVIKALRRRPEWTNNPPPIASFDDAAEASLEGLTTVRQDLVAQAGAACRQLIDHIGHREVRGSDHIAEPELIVRTSCGCSSRSNAEPFRDNRTASEALLEAALSLGSSSAVEVLHAKLAHQLIELNVDLCYLVAFESPDDPRATGRVTFGFDHRSRLVPEKDWSSFPIAELLPGSEWKRTLERDLVVETLSFGSLRLGYAVFSTASGSGIETYTLRSVIATALERIQKNLDLETTLAQLRSAQERIILSENLGLLGQISAGLTHELNSPLGAIQSASQSLQELFAESADWGQLSKNEIEVLVRAQRAHESGTGRASPDEKRELVRNLTALGAKDPEPESEQWWALGLGRSRDLQQHWTTSQQEGDLLGHVFPYFDGFVLSKLVAESARKASEVVTSLKHYLDLRPSEPLAWFPLGRSIDAAVSRLGATATKAVSIQKQIEESLKGHGRESDLRQVWLHLIRNAVQSMEGHGTLAIAARTSSTAWTVQITDDGPGVPSELGPLIFRPLQSTRRAEGGMGLGLDICQRIVQAHQGTLEFQSQPGLTTFTVTIPFPAR